MSSASRFLLVLAGASAWTLTLARPDLSTFLDPTSDVWNIPDLVSKFDALESQAELCDRRMDNLRRLYEGRFEVIRGLREQRLSVSEALARFSALAALREESGLGPVNPRKPFAPQSIVSQLLGWVKHERIDTKRQPDHAVLEQVEAELQCLIDSER